jgi:DMSO/TMAO reductase YedYZ molybdopterin-dependent catalytic subunit
MLAGLLAGAVAVGIGQLVAGVVAPASSPVVAVGEASIDSTPPLVKNFAINSFGSNDKTVLVAGILVVLALFAALIGKWAVRRLRNGMLGLAAFTAIGLAAALTRPTASPSWAAATLVGGAAAALALWRLVLRVPEPVSQYGTPLPGTPPQGTPPQGTPLPGTPPQGTPLPGTPPQGTPPTSQRRYQPGPPATTTTTTTERRSFLVAGGVAAGTAAVAYLGGRMLGERSAVTQAQKNLRIPPASHPAPPLPAGSDLHIPGLSSFITPNSSFYRVDTAIVLPEIAPTTWQLRIHGMVAREITLTFDDLIRRPLTAEYITLTCVSNPVAGPYVGNALWLGASLASLLRQAGVRAGADQLLCTSQDGFTSGTPLQTVLDGRDAMLAVAMNGTALPVEHGFPVRMVVPGLYGYVSACKWITDIEVTTYKANVAYWAQRGWFAQAPIKTESRIDVPTGNNPLKPGRTSVAGVAWAQHKGVDAVEVRVDKGPWQQAKLAAVPDIDCWRQWVLDWDAAPGVHVIEARATDATGYTQTALQAPPEPNGASGYPSLSVNVTGH